MKKFIDRERFFFEKNKFQFLDKYKDKEEYSIISELYDSLFLNRKKICEIGGSDTQNIIELYHKGVLFSGVLDNIVIGVIKSIQIKSKGFNTSFYLQLLSNFNKMILKVEFLENEERDSKIKVSNELKNIIKDKYNIENTLFLYKGLFIQKNLPIIDVNPVVVGLDEDLSRILPEIKEVYIPYDANHYLVCQIKMRTFNTVVLADSHKILKKKIHNRQSFRLNTLTRYEVHINKEEFLGEPGVLYNISKEGLAFLIKDKKDLEDLEIISIKIKNLMIDARIKYISHQFDVYKVGLEYIGKSVENKDIFNFLNEEQFKIINKVKNR